MLRRARSALARLLLDAAFLVEPPAVERPRVDPEPADDEAVVILPRATLSPAARAMVEQGSHPAAARPPVAISPLRGSVRARRAGGR